MEKLGRRLDSGIVVFEIPKSMALGLLAQSKSEGEDSLAPAEALVAEVKEAVSGGASKVVFDLSQLNYVDSAGVGIIVGCRNIVTDGGGAVRAVAPEDRVRKLLDLTKITSILPIDESLDEAVAALNAG